MFIKCYEWLKTMLFNPLAIWRHLPTFYSNAFEILLVKESCSESCCMNAKRLCRLTFSFLTSCHLAVYLSFTLTRNDFEVNHRVAITTLWLNREFLLIYRS